MRESLVKSNMPPSRSALLLLSLVTASLGISEVLASAAVSSGTAASVSTPSSPPTELLDANGKLASASEMTSLLSGFGGAPMSVVGVLGSKGSGKSTLLNKAFGTCFPVGRALGQGHATGVLASACDNVLLLDCDGAEDGADPSASMKGITTAAQATAFSAALSDVVLVNLWRSDLGRSVSSNTRTFKTFFSEKLQGISRGAEGGSSKIIPLVIAVHDCDPEADTSVLQAAVMEELEAVWDELGRPADAGSLAEHFDIQVVAVPHPRYHTVAYGITIEALRRRFEAVGASTATAGFRERVTNAWKAVREAGTTILPPKSELVAVYKVDAAYGEAMGKADGQLRAWRHVVGSGKIVPDFGKKSSSLYTSSLKAFDTQTVRFSSSSTRGSKRMELVTLLETGIKELYMRQLEMLCARAEKSYRNALLKLLETDHLDDASEADVLRKTLFAFEAGATALAPEVFKLDFEDEYEELEADLQEFSEKFADSPAAQSKAMRKLENEVKKPRGERSVGFGLGLVGMLRQEGYGNLQGFAGYRMGPHTVTVGYANDASIPDPSLGGEKPPLLRLQPKLNVDIDL